MSPKTAPTTAKAPITMPAIAPGAIFLELVLDLAVGDGEGKLPASYDDERIDSICGAAPSCHVH